MLILLGLVIVALPLTLTGDGTIRGQVQIVVSYTLGAAVLILAAATVWAGCAAISLEIETHRIHLVVTKPIGFLELWVGKWLGVLFLDACLLAVAGLGSYGMLLWTLHPGRLAPDERRELHEAILVARRVIRPVLPSRRAEAWELYRRSVERGLSDAERRLPAGEAVARIERRLKVQAASVPPGGRIRWEFRIPRGSDRGPLFLRYRFNSSQRSMRPVEGLWRAGGKTGMVFEVRRRAIPGGYHTVRIPAAAADKDGRLVIEYGNVEQEPVTLVFDMERLELLQYAGGFAGNFVRGLLVVVCGLGFLAAIGLFCGGVFSMPVATFTAGWFLLLLSMGDYIHSMAGRRIIFVSHGITKTAPDFADVFFRSFFRVMDVILRPLHGPHVMEMLADGRLISWGAVWAAGVVKLVVYPGCVALLGAYILRRRELGLAM